MDIGQRLKTARAKAHMTQEQVAGEIGVSRQTISNWETNKSYPDIISVIKLSDLYHMSLDVLLKEDPEMMNYLEESTNVVKSHHRLSKLMILLAYFVIWAVAILVFWLFNARSDAMGYALVYLWVIIPLTTFVTSLLLGRQETGRMKWVFIMAMGVMYMLSEYLTFSLANMLSFHHVNMPEFSMILIGAAIALVGHFIGTQTKQSHKETEEA